MIQDEEEAILPSGYTTPNHPGSGLTTRCCRLIVGEQKANHVWLPFPCSLFPTSPELIGIARLASEGESLREGHNVEYFTLPAKSLLNRCVSNRQMPFTWTINPYRGCEFGCRYCYARYTHEFMEMRDGMEFEQKIYVKQHAAGLLRHELRRVKADEAIALGTATDPYQPAERRYEVTRGILEEFALASRLRAWHRHQVESRGPRPRPAERSREDEQTFRAHYHHHSRCRTGTDSRAARAASRPSPRRRARVEPGGLARGHELLAGRAGNYGFSQRSGGVIRAAADAGADYVFANPLFLKPCSAAVFLPFLEQNFPHLAENYRQRYQDRAFLPPAYGKRLSQLIAHLREKYKITRAHRASALPLRPNGRCRLSTSS